MKLLAPRVIVIDDEKEHLEGLTRGLNGYGAACQPILFTSEPVDIPPCPNVRVIFADLHLTRGVVTDCDYAKDFSTISSLIEDVIKPVGPYFIVLWTMHSGTSENLHNYLKCRLQGVTKPFAVQSLDKTDHLDANGCVKSIDELIEAITRIVDGQPQVGALLDWEGWVSGAAACTVSSIVKLAESASADMMLSAKVGRLLASLAVAAVGEEHVEEDRFRAVNEALLPILADHTASLSSSEADNKRWTDAFGESNTGRGLSSNEAAELNRLLHIAPSTRESHGTERGAVIALLGEFSGDAFKGTFGLAPEVAACKQFWCKVERSDDRFRWVLVQSQAACDYAQMQPGPLPFYLGLCLPETKARKGTSPAALWTSPCFEFEGETHLLHVNARFQISLPSEKLVEKPLFRLREQLLNDLIYQLHSYGARPGIISLRESE